MNRDEFVETHKGTWLRTERLLDELKARTFEADHAELPSLYRRCCHHLALCRQRHYDAPLEARLHSIALRGYHRLYRRDVAGLADFARFFGAGFPRLVRRHAAMFWLAMFLFYGPGLAMGLLVLESPEAIYALLEPAQITQFEDMYREAPQIDRNSAEDFAAFGFYIFNNITIAFRTFAAGLFFGLGSVFFLSYNGLFLGGVFAHLTHAGSSGNLLTFVITHGAFELTALVLAGVGGLMLGASLISPGRRRRLDALRHTAPDALRIALGAGGLLVLAAFLEAFFSGSPWATPSAKILVGAFAWIGVALYLSLGGRRGT